jgi:hypothetical protein
MENNLIYKKLKKNEIHRLTTNEERMNYILSGGMTEIPAELEPELGCQCAIM